jgi:CheY-like chemotaxis protein
MRAVRRFCRTSTPIEESAPRVLVVGSDSDLSKLISSTLADAEYVPRVVTELRDAPAVARRIGAKAAVIYLGGRRTIVDVVDALRGHAASRHIPIVACVVTSQLSDLQRAHLGEQRVRVLTLPLTPEELVDAVDRLLLDDGHA